ncbi:hypothetical protein LFT44_13025 [Arthrobacter sp. FW306-05-C]|uniref:hypothetical protein n=1 Tax=Arthrobacter sp. FW306-05-C TaxID=2879620 RepID=UPI001F1E7A0A|nr:hypothetical protein [Arthrobacter sp. FW306-05-C]UKA65439.1 hypothetical protein LFT44_13025 [Arthrobacter sp. FW306-05-C]
MSAQRIITTRSAATVHGFTRTTNHEPTAWLKNRLQLLAADLDAGHVTHCGHLNGNGAVGIIGLWAPRKAVCRDCQHLIGIQGAADRTCDRCGHHDPAGVTLSAVRPIPALIVLMGLCDACQRKEAAK